MTRRLQPPHPRPLLTACILAAAVLSWIVPAGQYDRRDDPATGRTIVVAGSYHRADAHPVGPFDTLLAILHGMIDAAPVIFFVFLVGGAITVVEETGALRGGHQHRRLGHRRRLPSDLRVAASVLRGRDRGRHCPPPRLAGASL